MGSEEFTTWLNAEVESRGWTFGELGRRADLSSGGISKVMTQQAQPRWEFCLKVSHALRIPPEQVFRIAGLLPSLPPAVEEEREVLAILRRLQASVRATAITMLRALARDADLPVGVNEPAVPYITNDRHVRELLEEFAQVPEDWQEMVIAQARQYRLMAETRPMHIIGEEDLERERGTETT